MATKKTTTAPKAVKTAPVNAKTAPVTKAAAEPKPAEKKPVAEKPAVKKPAAKRPAAKKEIKVKTVVEYYGKQAEEKDMISAVKKAWTKSGRKVGDIKNIELYVKPEEGAVYYVINGVDSGAVPF